MLKEKMDFDDLIERASAFGSFQKKVFVAVCLASAIVATRSMAVVFLLAAPPHRCQAPGVDNDTYMWQSSEHQAVVNETLLWPVNGQDFQLDMSVDDPWARAQCYTPAGGDGRGGNVTQVSNKTTLRGREEDAIPCGRWVFDKSNFEETFVTERGLVCDSLILKSHANMAYTGGALAGSLIMGAFSDRFGRKPTLIVSLAIVLASSGVLVVWSPDFYMFVTLRVVTGFGINSLYVTCTVLGMELVGKTYRSMAGMLVVSAYAVGLLVLDLAACLFRHWRPLQVTLAVCSLPVLLLCFIPESPRWQLSTGRVRKAIATLKKVARSNGKELDLDVEDGDKIFSDSQTSPTTLRDLITSPKLMARFVILAINWLVVSLLYFGLTFQVSNLSGNVYLNFLLNALAEIVSAVASWIALPRWGRRNFHCFCMLLGGAACLSAIIAPLCGMQHELSWLMILLSNIGKFGVSGSFNTIYIFTSELFPTPQRSRVVGLCSTIARVGGMGAPYIVDLGKLFDGPVGNVLPNIVFGSSALGAGLLALVLPETLGKSMPETVQDALSL